jgi:hypothetical protein
MQGVDLVGLDRQDPAIDLLGCRQSPGTMVLYGNRKGLRDLHGGSGPDR